IIGETFQSFAQSLWPPSPCTHLLRHALQEELKKIPGAMYPTVPGMLLQNVGDADTPLIRAACLERSSLIIEIYHHVELLILLGMGPVSLLLDASIDVIRLFGLLHESSQDIFHSDRVGPMTLNMDPICVEYGQQAKLPVAKKWMEKIFCKAY
ncbi:hypothetical protein ACJX0J_035385, partial [Zea mays]